MVSFPSYRSRLVAETRTTAGNYNISATGMRRLKFVRPPLEVQDRFLMLDDTVAETRARMDRSVVGNDELFNSLAQRAFLGGGPES